MATGTYTVPELTAEQVQRILVKPLEDRSVFLLNGMTQAPTWVGENEEIPDTAELDTKEMTLMPPGMKSIKIISRFSNELARQSIVDLSVVLKDRLVSDVANTLDQALLTSADATGLVPRGLLFYEGTQQMPAIGTLGLDDLHDAIGMMLSANVDVSRVRWFMRHEVFVHLRKLKDGNDRYQLQPDPTSVGGYTLLGIPVTVTDRLPLATGTPDSSAVVLADFSTIAVARDLAPSVTVLPELFAKTDQIGIRVITRYDAKPMLPEGILIMRGVTV
jgi:HK97 family phage major capsid protein